MLSPRKNNHVSCLSLLTELSETSFHGKRRSASIAIIGIFCTCMYLSVYSPRNIDPRTPVPHNYSSSPEIDYFIAPIARNKPVSRWKEDWEELELLVRSFSPPDIFRLCLLSRVEELSAQWLKLATRSTLVSMPVCCFHL